MQKNRVGFIQSWGFVNWECEVKMWTTKFRLDKKENKERRGLMDDEKMEVSTKAVEKKDYLGRT